MTFSEDEIDRYARHLVLSEIGGPGQQRLKAARVMIVGMGGVGGPAALYLAAAGVGHLTLIDPDTVALSNLQRQIQFATPDVGAPKVEVSARRLIGLNPHVAVQTVASAFTVETVAGHDAVIDGTDDFAVRHVVNAACVATKVPLVSGALGRWTAQIGVFGGRPCYRCLVPEHPVDAETCARVGVVGALAGIVGAMAALETIKIITGAGEPLTGRLLLYDGLNAAARTVTVSPDPACPVCG